MRDWEKYRREQQRRERIIALLAWAIAGFIAFVVLWGIVAIVSWLG
jgi:hypothetical protein